MDFSGPFSALKTFVGPIHNTVTEMLAKSATCAVDAGAPPPLASRLSVVSPPSTIGATVPAPQNLISSRTRHRTAAAAGTPRATADYGFGARPSRSASTGHRTPAPLDRGPPRPSQPTTPQVAPPPPASAGRTAGARWLKIFLDTFFSASGAPRSGARWLILDIVFSASGSPRSGSRWLKVIPDIVFFASCAPRRGARRPARRCPFKTTATQPVPRPPTSPPLSMPEPVVEPDDYPHLLSCVDHFTHTDWARKQRAEPLCSATIRLLSLSSPPTDHVYLFPSSRRPKIRDVLALAGKKNNSTTPTTTPSSWFDYHLSPHTLGTTTHLPPPHRRALTFRC